MPKVFNEYTQYKVQKTQNAESHNSKCRKLQ